MDYANANNMNIIFKKTKLMIFNPCYSIDFMPKFNLEDNELEIVDDFIDIYFKQSISVLVWHGGITKTE